MEEPKIDEFFDADGSTDTQRMGVQLEKYRDRLSRMIELRMDPRLRGRVDTGDVLQEAAIEIYQRLPEYRAKPDVPFYVWVRFLVIQKLAQIRRHHLGAQKRDARKEVSLQAKVSMAASTAILADTLIQSGDSPSQEFMRHERRHMVVEILESLSELDRETLALRHLEGLTNQECAAVLEIEESASSRRYLRAVTRFSEALRRRTEGESGV